MKRIVSLFALVVLGFGFPLLGVEPEPSPTPSPSPEKLTHLEQADERYSQRTEKTGADEALLIYENAIQDTPDSAQAHWKAARACHWIADHSTDKKEKLALFEKGIELAKKSIQLDPKLVEAHFWLGALYGSYGETRGILKSLALIQPIRNEMKTVVRLNDRFEGGAGYRVLGIVDYKVPPFAGGSKKRALENLNKAFAIDSTNAFNAYYLAEYHATTGNKAKATELLNNLRTLTVNDDVDKADLKMIQEKGEKLLKSLE